MLNCCSVLLFSLFFFISVPWVSTAVMTWSLFKSISSQSRGWWVACWRGHHAPPFRSTRTLHDVQGKKIKREKIFQWMGHHVDCLDDLFIYKCRYLSCNLIESSQQLLASDKSCPHDTRLISRCFSTHHFRERWNFFAPSQPVNGIVRFGRYKTGLTCTRRILFLSLTPDCPLLTRWLSWFRPTFFFNINLFY